MRIQAAAMLDPDEPENDRHRRVENIALGAGFLVLVGAGIWLLTTMAEVRRVQDCTAQGRRDCGAIEMPDRAR
jgi:hypothetical protein